MLSKAEVCLFLQYRMASGGVGCCQEPMAFDRARLRPLVVDGKESKDIWVFSWIFLEGKWGIQ
ncbi:hypothetical protein B5F54_08280 [Anaeromassilibacillus sp. An250]|nr:hypothetical protein B5F54_08280 [Anaeromassilibacillus sp. An250]